MTPHSTLMLMLAKKLPEKIVCDEVDGYTWIKQPYSGDIIRDTEWDYIVRLVEEKMGEDDAKNYIIYLDNGSYWELVHASWPERAEAMKQIGFLKE